MTLAISSLHAALLVALREEGAPRVVVIGAVALAHHVTMTRSTADVDLAVVAEIEEISDLLGRHGWTRDGHLSQRWCREQSKIDVLPATPRLVESGFLRAGEDERTMSLVGFDLAVSHAQPVSIPGRTETVEVASLAAIVVLKMVAWLDRPHERLKDLGDLALVLGTALDDFDERRWEPPLVDLPVEVQSESATIVGMHGRDGEVKTGGTLVVSRSPAG